MSVILLRLIPTAPRLASDFLTDLTGLEIDVYDLTVDNNQNGVGIGSAYFNEDLTKTTIYQHFKPPDIIPTVLKLPLDPTSIYSVATAVIVAKPPPGHLEYDTFDLRLKITRKGQTILDDTIEFNVNLFQPATSPVQYFGLEPSVYFQLPPAPSAALTGTVSVTLPSSGQPPDFYTLRTAINIVLKQDHPTPQGVTNPPNNSLETLSSYLTPGQAGQIASEITWNRTLNPAPTSTITLQGTSNPIVLSDMYTIPLATDSKGKVITDSNGNPVAGSIPSGSPQDLGRQQFEANLSGYRSKLTATSTKLASFVFAASAAVWCEQQTANAAQAGITVPIDTAPNAVPPKFSDTSVLVTKIDANAFIVPAVYFYILGATFPTQISAQQRYTSALLATENQLLSTFQAALDANALNLTEPPVTVTGSAFSIYLAQAARRIVALGDITGSPPPITYDSVKDLMAGWLGYTGSSTSIDLNYWIGVPKTQPGAIDKYPLEYVRLLLEAITMDSKKTVIAILGKDGPATPTQIKSVEQLVAVTTSQWTTFFTTNSGVLPPFTAPGNTAQRITAFLTRFTKFFDITADAPTQSTSTGGTISNFGTPPSDPLLAFTNAYGSTFSFAQKPDSTLFDAALKTVFPSNAEYREWLRRAVNTIFALYQVTSGITGITSSASSASDFQFSLMEALYARGFTSAEEISALSPEEFQKALTGSVAFTYAGQIQSAAPKPAATPQAPSKVDTSPKVDDEGFHPVNADGDLVNFIPPKNLSPLGKIAYLHDLLGVKVGNSTLGDIVALRRGPVGKLLCTTNNLEIPIPQIDLVNESLEFLGTNLSTAHGTVHDTTIPTPDDNAVELLSAVSTFSSPAIPPAPIYAILRNYFTAPDLPYLQAEDISRSYLGALKTSRFDVMRRFRRDITELAVDASLEPAGFQKNIWRYPVRLELALEYINISVEEYLQLFNGKWTDTEVLRLFGYQVNDAKLFTVPGFLKSAGLSYGEFIELWKCKYVLFTSNLENGEFPVDEPCCPKKLKLKFAATGNDLEFELHQLFVFIRLWRRLKEIRGPNISFHQLADICSVLGLFIEKKVNRDFLRQLAALLLLRDQFGIPLTTQGKGKTPVESTPFLALWADQTGKTPEWTKALNVLASLVERYAHVRYGCKPRKNGFEKVFTENHLPLSELAGFTTVDTWYAKPTSTLRFIEVVAKLYASKFTLAEILFVFTVGPHLPNDDPFPVSPNMVDPLALPATSPFDLWCLRRKLLEIEIPFEQVDLSNWTWDRIENVLRELGYSSSSEEDPLKTLAEHFFPFVLETGGTTVQEQNSQFRVDLPSSETNPLMWNAPHKGPFGYDTKAQQLWATVPLTDKAVLHKLKNVRQLSSNEINAVQRLYFAPRAALAPFAVLFSNFRAAVHILTEDPNPEERFRYFQGHAALFFVRCEIIAQHIAEHVSAVTHSSHSESAIVAWDVLRTLIADENRPVPDQWENDSGVPPTSFQWNPKFSGSAFAALLGLTGTGMLEEFSSNNIPVWRDVSGGLSFWGRSQDEANAPIPTILPSLSFASTPAPQGFATVSNGFALNGQVLGGAQPFRVTWSGALLIENAGQYTFHAGSPTPLLEEPNFDAAKHHRWLITLVAGDRVVTVLNHLWQAQSAPQSISAPISLDRGVHHFEIQFEQPPPGDDEEFWVHHLHTGFQLKYEGPDTEGLLMSIPAQNIFMESTNTTLSDGLKLCDTATAFLNGQFPTSLSSIRRTYQRAFKAVLFVHQFGLSAKPHHGQSELRYLLDHKENFRGSSYYRTKSGFQTHQAYFDLNFLAVSDPYNPPSVTVDQRVQPSLERQAAIFDWWERYFDYTRLREWTHAVSNRHVWTLFSKANTQPSPPKDQLFPFFDIEAKLADLVLSYFVPGPIAMYQVQISDLVDERWAIRLSHAQIWCHDIKIRFHTENFGVAIPHLWAANYSNLAVDGNNNLMLFFQLGAMGANAPHTYKEVKHINDELRQRARAGLLQYLCDKNRVAMPFGTNVYVHSPQDLSDLLLQDVGASLYQSASRIEDSLAAIQTFIQRARLGLEPGYMLTPEFEHSWETEFATFKVWETWKRRQLYQENWIHCEELRIARKSEGYQFLENQLSQNFLTIPKSGGLVWWTDTSEDPSYLNYLQSSELASFQTVNNIEGLSLLGQPAFGARSSLLATLPNSSGGTITNSTAESASVSTVAVSTPTENLPIWVKAAIKMGAQFIRVAAAKTPAAVTLSRSDAPARCPECEKIHPPVVDEYYFWISNGHYFDPKDAQQNPMQDVTQAPSPVGAWDNPTPSMLQWNPETSVHLYWTRIHFGRFDPPRRSFEGVPVQANAALQLSFLGRTVDSLLFTVAPTDSGFRYDMAQDSAVVLPQPLPDSHSSGLSIPSPLSSYPFFIYFEPGAPLIPLSNFSIALTIAGSLRSHCHFREALKWYELAFNPQRRDNKWAQCPKTQAPQVTSLDVNSPCCPNRASSTEVSRSRAILLEYVETLLDWGDVLMSKQSDEATREAMGVFHLAERILGLNPKTVEAVDQSSPSMTVSTFEPLAAPLNPRLLALYNRIGDQRFLIRDQNTRGECTCSKVLGQFDGKTPCCVSLGPCQKSYPYRFTAVLPKALELAELVSSFGASLLGAFEKGDAEYIQNVRSLYERQISTLAISSSKNHYRESDWEKQALQQSLANALERYNYYTNLINNGLNAGEQGFVASTEADLASLAASIVSQGIADVMQIIPDIAVGAAGAFGSPLELTTLPVGSKLANSFSIAAAILNSTSQIAGTVGNLELTQSQWDRRTQEWNQEIDSITIELEQIECQKLASDRRSAIAMNELNNQLLQIQQSAEVQDFMRDKFTAQDLYFFLQQETAALYRQSYNLALQTAHEAQKLFWYELRTAPWKFLPELGWDNLREGLLAGEKLQLALRTMERAYMEENCRENEIMKHISLRTMFPAAFLQLKVLGYCELDLPEWIFDLDYPGQYMRRIKNVSLTIPCVTGPYISINCRLSLRSNVIRIQPTLIGRDITGAAGKGDEHGYEMRSANDPRFVYNHAATDSIATSTGQMDSGMFTLDFNDERYLPFEYAGAISHWRIELPPENNQFQVQTLTDLVVHLNYTSREGGDELRRAANRDAQKHLPGDGWRLFDIRNEFPTAWELFLPAIQHKQRGSAHKHSHNLSREFHLQFTRNMFPFVTGNRVVQIVSLQPFIEVAHAEVGEHIKLKYQPHGQNGKDTKEFDCVVTGEWPTLFHGVLDAKIGPIHGPQPLDFGTLVYPESLSHVVEIYMLCRYEVSDHKEYEQKLHHQEHQKIRGQSRWMVGL